MQSCCDLDYNSIKPHGLSQFFDSHAISRSQARFIASCGNQRLNRESKEADTMRLMETSANETSRDLDPDQARRVSKLLKEHYTLVFAIANARLRDRDAAEDLAQEVFLRALVRLD